MVNTASHQCYYPADTIELIYSDKSRKYEREAVESMYAGYLKLLEAPVGTWLNNPNVIDGDIGIMYKGYNGVEVRGIHGLDADSNLMLFRGSDAGSMTSRYWKSLQEIAKKALDETLSH